MNRLDFYFTKPFHQGEFVVDFVIDNKVVKTELVQNRYYDVAECEALRGTLHR